MIQENQRLLSIDVLQGHDHCIYDHCKYPWIMGICLCSFAPCKMGRMYAYRSGISILLFIVGLSMAQSIKSHQNFTKQQLFLKALKRTAVIFGIGLFSIGFLFDKPLAELRIFGVLQRIALAYFAGACISIYVKEKYHLWTTMIILVLYYLVLIMGVTVDPSPWKITLCERSTLHCLVKPCLPRLWFYLLIRKDCSAHLVRLAM